jgi:hypothetical protein
MTARYALRPTLAASPTRLGHTLLLLVALSFGCVNLKQPWALAHPDGSAAGTSGGTSGASTVTGSGGTISAGGASGGTAVDAGQGGTTITSSGASDSQGGSSAIDTSSVSTGGSGSEGGTGAGGSAGETGTAGSTGTGSLAGAGGTGTGGTGGKTGTAGSTGTGSVAGAGGTGTGGTGGFAGTSGKGGTGGQTSAVPDAGPDVAADTARDTLLPDAFCELCAIGKSLVHRYNFNGNGTTVTDSVGTANGTVMNAQLSGSGTLVLTGGTSNQYADFPDHILNTLTSATLELWVTWTGGNNNQRILDFGSNRTSGSNTLAVTTVIISPNTFLDNTARLRASYCSDASIADSSIFTDATSTLATGSMQQVVAVFDGQAHTLTMYVNGAAQGTAATGLGALSAIDDVNNYLGKSQYSGDPGFAGTYHEFRIFNAALTAAQVQAVFTAGQNASFN